jgi:hypothetical protein
VNNDPPSHDTGDEPVGAGNPYSVGPPSATPPPIPPFTPLAPPTTPGEMVLPAQRSVWPIPVGIVVIVLSVWTVLSAMGTLMTGFGGSFMAASAGTGEEEIAMMQVMADHKWHFIVAGAMLFVAAGLGIAGGIGLLVRKRWGVVVLFVFGFWKLLASAVHAVGQASFMAAMMNVSMPTASLPGSPPSPPPPPPPPPPPGMVSGMTIGMGVFYFIAGAVLPAFILIWLWMPNIRKDYKQW